MYNLMKWLRLLGGWHFIAATAIKSPKAACQFAADDILLYEFCYYNPMDLLHHLEKGNDELSPLHTILSLYISYEDITRSLLRSQIYHVYEELSTDTDYPIWRRQERRSKYSVQLASWQLRSNSPKTSVCHTFFTMFPSSYHHKIFRSDYQWQKWYPCKRSRSGDKGQGHRGQRLTYPFPDCNSSWKHTWLWNDGKSLG